MCIFSFRWQVVDGRNAELNPTNDIVQEIANHQEAASNQNDPIGVPSNEDTSAEDAAPKVQSIAKITKTDAASSAPVSATPVAPSITSPGTSITEETNAEDIALKVQSSNAEITKPDVVSSAPAASTAVASSMTSSDAPITGNPAEDPALNLPTPATSTSSISIMTKAIFPSPPIDEKVEE